LPDVFYHCVCEFFLLVAFDHPDRVGS
jgi:hypothetical protein